MCAWLFLTQPRLPTAKPASKRFRSHRRASIAPAAVRMLGCTARAGLGTASGERSEPRRYRTRTSNPPVNSLFFPHRSRQFGAIWPVFIGVFRFGGPPETTRDRARLSRFCPSATVGLKLTRIDSTSTGSIEIDRIESKTSDLPETTRMVGRTPRSTSVWSIVFRKFSYESC